MKTNKEQLLRNPDIRPSEDVLAKALGEANNAYVKFINKLARYDIQLVWRYYKDGKAWLAKGLYTWMGVRGGRNETTLFWLSIWDGFFKVTIFVPQKYHPDLLSLELDQEVRQMISESKQMGKLKYFPLVFEISTDVLFDDLFILLQYRKSIR